jgi:hypothetical protein
MNRGVNRQVKLKARPSGIPQAEHFEIVEAPVPEPANGQILVRNLLLSVDPAMRGWVSSVANYSDPVPVGGVMRGVAVGRVAASRHPASSRGDVVTGLFGWQDHAVVDESSVQRRITGEALGFTGVEVVGAIRPHFPEKGRRKGAKKTRADAGKKAEPKDRDPKTGETWSGRGRPAGWLKAYMDAGKRKEDFLIKK